MKNNLLKSVFLVTISTISLLGLWQSEAKAYPYQCIYVCDVACPDMGRCICQTVQCYCDTVQMWCVDWCNNGAWNGGCG